VLRLIKYFSFVLLIFYSFNLLAFNNSDKEEWYEIVKQYYLDYETGLDEYKNKNYNKAFKIFLNLAKSGDARAQSDIAGMYFNGWGVNVDHKRAFYWYKKASKNGNAYAQYKLGDMYWNGFGVDINTDTAQIWWKKAADNGYKDAQFNLPYQYCYLNKPQCQ
tara:strand:+ start:122 stop:607 length:486 start_codon:yes stop_codon:yes gene_type:complete